jgi:spermidine synthase
VAGVLLTGFVLIGRFGIHAPLYGAIVGNGLIGAAAFLLSRRGVRMQQPGMEPPGSEACSPAAPQPLPRGIHRLALVGLGLSGFTSFAYEVYWTRSLVFILGNSTYALTTMLSAFLTGIAVGGWLIRYPLARAVDRAALFGWIQVLLGVSSALALPLLFLLFDPQQLGQRVVAEAAQPLPLAVSGFGVAFLVMLAPAILIGATFPLVAAMDARDHRETGAIVGRAYAVNTAGNVLGALAPGLFLLGWLGIQRGILAMAAINAALGFTLLLLRLFRPDRNRGWRVAWPVAVLLAALLMSRVPLGFEFPSESETPHDQTLYYHEGPLATTKVYVNPESGDKLMSVDGIVIGGTANTEFKQLLLAHLPKLLLADASTELSVGVGSGILMGESARHAQVRRITGVEIEPGVVRGASFFREENHGVLSDPRVDVVIDDIGNFLRTSDDRYRVISADEKTADEYASNGFSYSLDYYELLRQHLAPGGLVAQWVPATLPTRQFRMILKTFTEGFPHVQLWYFLPAYKRGPFNAILIGSRDPITIDPARIDRRLRDEPAAFSSLAPYGLTSAEAILPHFVADERVLRDAVRDAELNTLDHPRYEFFHPWDYARNRQEKIVANHRLVLELKRAAFPRYFARLRERTGDLTRLQQSFAAEFRYLEAFGRFLQGMPASEQYRVFDAVLNLAPWNDSLRARIYAQYTYLANSRGDPRERAMMRRKAESLYR